MLCTRNYVVYILCDVNGTTARKWIVDHSEFYVILVAESNCQVLFTTTIDLFRQFDMGHHESVLA